MLQHGFLGGGGYWAPVLPALSRRFDVVCPVLPGVAGSVDEPIPGDRSGFAAALVRLLDDLGIDKTHLLGHSPGSMTALQLALDFPDRVERLVLVGSACVAELPGRFEAFDQTMGRLASESIEATLDRIVTHRARARFATGNQQLLKEALRRELPARSMGPDSDAAAQQCGRIDSHCAQEVAAAETQRHGADQHRGGDSGHHQIVRR